MVTQIVQPYWKTISNATNTCSFDILQQELGKGSYGTVYIANLHSNAQVQYACKIIQKNQLLERISQSKKPEATRDKILRQINNELTVSTELDHVNLVKLHEFIETGNSFYFIMDYCNGGTLTQLLKQQNGVPLDEKLAFKYFQELVEGSFYLWQKGVIHRDIKPDNILLHNNICKISDFGLSKKLDEQRDLSQIQTLVGTPLYMAPQVLEGSQYSIKCDVWSLGIVGYLLFSGGFFPFEITSDISQYNLYKVVSETQQIQFPKSIKIRSELVDLIQNMLKVDENARLSIEQVQEILSKVKIGDKVK